MIQKKRKKKSIRYIGQTNLLDGKLNKDGKSTGTDQY